MMTYLVLIGTANDTKIMIGFIKRRIAAFSVCGCNNADYVGREHRDVVGALVKNRTCGDEDEVDICICPVERFKGLTI
jgi:hypothetical protein